ncbi:MAG: hypothetical protein KGZ79_07605 [Dethiobacter sp.]|nr:hypothetical protein [Dethiobacter sp.]
MLADVIKEIRSAEEKAEDMRRRAHIDSRKILQEAERKVAGIIQQSAAAATAESKDILAAAEQAAKELAVPIAKQADGEITRLKEAARDKQEQAIKLVMERIVKTYGHS